jgi:ABC-type sugar transport system substrate-binding protein
MNMFRKMFGGEGGPTSEEMGIQTTPNSSESHQEFRLANGAPLYHALIETDESGTALNSTDAKQTMNTLLAEHPNLEAALSGLSEEEAKVHIRDLAADTIEADAA